MVGLTGLIFKFLTKIWQKFPLWICIVSHHHFCSHETLALLFSSHLNVRNAGLLKVEYFWSQCCRPINVKGGLKIGSSDIYGPSAWAEVCALWVQYSCLYFLFISIMQLNLWCDKSFQKEFWIQCLPSFTYTHYPASRSNSYAWLGFQQSVVYPVLIANTMSAFTTGSGGLGFLFAVFSFLSVDESNSKQTSEQNIKQIVSVRGQTSLF